MQEERDGSSLEKRAISRSRPQSRTAGAKTTEVQDFRAASAPAVPTAGCSRAAGPRSPRGLGQHQTLPPRQGDAFALLRPICLDSIFFKVSEGKPGFFFSSSLRFFFSGWQVTSQSRARGQVLAAESPSKLEMES